MSYKQLADELTAAHERIRELEKLLEDANRGAQRNAIINQSLAGKLTAERAISDKLEKALETIVADMSLGRFDEDAARAVLAEAAAMRKGEQV